MQAVRSHQTGVSQAIAGDGRDVKIFNFIFIWNLQIGFVESVNALADARVAVAKRGKSVIGNGNNEHFFGFIIGKFDGLFQQILKLNSVIYSISIAILIVNTNQQRHHIVGAVRNFGILDCRCQFVGRPTRSGDDSGVSNAPSRLRECRAQLHGITKALVHALPDGVRVAERKVSKGRCVGRNDWRCVLFDGRFDDIYWGGVIFFAILKNKNEGEKGDYF